MSSNLAYALTKVQFSRITESTFNKNSDNLIEELNDIYPISVTKQIESVEFQFNRETNEQKTIKNNVPIVTLKSADKKWGVNMTQDHVILHTNAYISFEDFEERFSFILCKIKETMLIKHMEFVGLRYINKFDEDSFSKNFKRNEFLQPNLCGFNMAGSNLASRYADGKLGININSGVTVNNTKLPPDIAELNNDLGSENPILNGAWAHLDIDCYSVNHELIPYDYNNIIETLNELRDRAKSIYCDIVISEQ
ncbi:MULTISPECIES: TIGR04255 family protein [unclassified Pseudoalteromonas]|uniref:TIGR04255 family protein n=1 Tax=unclassified Pseudoalteromonas TaxID=194690 RepID=UPI00140AB2E1|nr:MULTISPECIES: TIGR04255 family protein [unclassified Pseudoalteromonas]MBH0049071.1 TIGR04255 family protein [Pseudoalteromonas sp. SWYJZ19]